MKQVSKLILIIVVLGFASCASHETPTQTPPAAQGTGYHK